jgi:Domain of unknown function (DUF4062)
MTPKYQIFISSTYADLRAEREQVITAVLEMGHIPVGMEMFSAADEEQWKLIARQVDETDYYVVIAAHRYGSTTADGLSFTEREYDYALSRSVPILAFLIDDNAPWPADRMDTDPTARASLTHFKDKLKQRHVGFWSTGDELHGKVAIALVKLFATQPRPGWVRASALAGPDVVTELSRLSAENAQLRLSLDQAKLRVHEDTEARRRRLLSTLSNNKIGIRIWYLGDTNWAEAREVPLLRLFQHIAPELVIERSTPDLSKFVGALFKKEGSQTRKEWPVPSNAVKAWLADLMALGLVEPSPRKHSVSDTSEYWSLTAAGREFLGGLRRLMLEEHPTEAQEELQQHPEEPDGQ